MSSDDAIINESSPKKPRIRHTGAQLVALNDLYEENEHPSLGRRADLADVLGMDTKAVNAWFANKRSATKKKSRSLSTPMRMSPSMGQLVTAEDEDESHISLYDMEYVHASEQSASGVVEHTQLLENEKQQISGKMRQRPTVTQIEELKKLFKTNSHPSREDREQLGIRIGMRYQSVTNWFQNQRSISKKRKGELSSHQEQFELDDILFQSHPPSTSPSSSKSLLTESFASVARGSYSGILDTSPCNRSSIMSVSRSRRVRPEPYQLEALRKVFERTSNPSIEERGALALAIGMDVGKVTNWFRNLRQTARKRAPQTGEELNDDGLVFESASVSRLGSPSSLSSASSTRSTPNVDTSQMELDGVEFGQRMNMYSDLGSDEDYQEAVTPPPVTSTKSSLRRMNVDFITSVSTPDESPEHYYKPVAGVRVEDALLLLSFSRHISQ